MRRESLRGRALRERADSEEGGRKSEAETRREGRVEEGEGRVEEGEGREQPEREGGNPGRVERAAPKREEGGSKSEEGSRSVPLVPMVCRVQPDCSLTTLCNATDLCSLLTLRAVLHAYKLAMLCLILMSGCARLPTDMHYASPVTADIAYGATCLHACDGMPCHGTA